MTPVFRLRIRCCRKPVQAVLVAAIACLCSLLGQLTQPEGGLSVLWPANALLTALLVRHPSLSHPQSWAGALGGMLLANIVFEDMTWPAALGYGITDLSGVLIAWAILTSSWSPDQLRNPRAIGRVLAACTAAAATNAAVALALTPWLRPDEPWMTIALNWFFGQLLSYCAFLPPIMLLPRRFRPRGDRRHAWSSLLRRMRNGTLLLPLAALIASVSLCFLLGGPGAAAFPIPALMYCALAYRQGTTAWITLLTALIVMLGAANGWVPLGQNHPLAGTHAWDMVSLRLGVLLLIMSPLLVSGILAARSDLISSLSLALDHDSLTRALSRQAFLRSADEHLGRTPAPPQGNALLMLDIDHFKQLNDRHGHAAGDQVLKAFAQTIRTLVRPHDLFGRLGGEEFALFLPDTSERDAGDIAERLRFCVEKLSVPLDACLALRISVSIGTVHDARAPFASLSELLAYADQAMYQAKRSGRNQVHAHGGLAAHTEDTEDPAWPPPLNNAPKAP
ncbi:diguanylate cyclase [Castellaniella ginsengisoli]|uniref:diguanylate cyclase n=1 Tax=Castellaniella ginsengisoli TaxID=546114 RepID=A0AB39DA31_9BURK